MVDTAIDLLLVKDVRVFEEYSIGSRLLGNTGKWIRAGETIHVGETRTMVYDHRYQSALPVLNTSPNRFVIVLELEADPWFVVKSREGEDSYITLNPAHGGENVG